MRKGRKGALGIVEVKCLGVCPKGAVTVVNAAAPGEWMLWAALHFLLAGRSLKRDRIG